MPVGFPDYYGGLTLPVTVAEGGTGQTSVTAKALLYGAGTSGLIATNVGTANQVLQIDSVTLNPTFKDLVVNVSSITGILPVANGGTGTATPALVAGANIVLSGTWPAETIAVATSPVFTSTSNTSGVAASFQDASANTLVSVGVLANTNGGRGYLNVINPTADGTGCGFSFSSNGGLHTGLFQLDGTGNMVFRNALSNMYFDFGGTLYCRNGDGGTVELSIDHAGTVSLNVPLPVASGGTGTATPGLVAGANIVLSGSWPAQTIAVATPIIIGTKGVATALAIELGSSGIATSYAQFGTNQSTISGVAGDLLNMADGSVGWKVAFDKSGNLGLAGTLHLGTVLSVADGGTGAATLLAAGIPHIVANVDLTAQTATIVTTALITPGVAGMYRASVEVYLKSTTGTSTITVNMIWVQEGGNTGNQAAVNLTLAATSGVASGTVLLYSDAGFAISYNASWTSGGVGDQYDLHIRLEAL